MKNDCSLPVYVAVTYFPSGSSLWNLADSCQYVVRREGFNPTCLTYWYEVQPGEAKGPLARTNNYNIYITAKSSSFIWGDGDLIHDLTYTKCKDVDGNDDCYYWTNLKDEGVSCVFACCGDVATHYH